MPAFDQSAEPIRKHLRLDEDVLARQLRGQSEEADRIFEMVGDTVGEDKIGRDFLGERQLGQVGLAIFDVAHPQNFGDQFGGPDVLLTHIVAAHRREVAGELDRKEALVRSQVERGQDTAIGDKFAYDLTQFIAPCRMDRCDGIGNRRLGDAAVRQLEFVESFALFDAL